MKQMYKALFRLDDFCRENEITYALTGTFALQMLGIPSSVGDIDIIVFGLTAEQKQNLNMLEHLSCLEKESYENGNCYSFMVDGNKVNAIIDKSNDYQAFKEDSVLVDFPNMYRCIRVHKVYPALKAKMKLARPKDKTFMLDLISKLASL